MTAELEARILANPDDADAYSVYGDWLTERGDPRGELVALQRTMTERELTGAAIEPELRVRELKLFEANPQWLGSLAKLQLDDFQLTWRNGFPWSARVGPRPESHRTSDTDFEDTINELFGLPGIQFLHELAIGAPYSDDWPATWYDSIRALTGRVPAGLRKLSIDRGYYDSAHSDLGDLSQIYPTCRGLHELSIDIGMFVLGDAVDLPELRSLELMTHALSTNELQAIRAGNLPHLDELLLGFGATGGDYGGNIELSDLDWLFAGDNLATLRHLGLANSSLADELIEPLARSKILPQLVTLDLSRGTFGAEGARALLDHADAFRHLESIDLSQSYLDADTLAQLETIGPQIIAEDMNQAAERDERYVAIGE